MNNEKLAIAISDYLHTLDVTQPLAYYMARGLSIDIANVVLEQPRTFMGMHIELADWMKPSHWFIRREKNK